MSGWIKPWNLGRGRCSTERRSLFALSVDEILAELKVSRDECQRWERKGWLSFEVAGQKYLESPLEDELEFIATIARSGLNDALIGKLLDSLERPYSYDPRRVAYSFRDGWVQCPQEAHPHEVIDEHIDDYLRSLVGKGETNSLLSIQEKIANLLEDGEEDGEEDDD